jgi:hypothetical protein
LFTGHPTKYSGDDLYLYTSDDGKNGTYRNHTGAYIPIVKIYQYLLNVLYYLEFELVSFVVKNITNDENLSGEPWWTAGVEVYTNIMQYIIIHHYR